MVGDTCRLLVEHSSKWQAIPAGLEHLHRRAQSVSQNATSVEIGIQAEKWPAPVHANQASAWASPINEPALLCRPLCGRILSGAPVPRDSANPTVGA
jgi:hypothetical protein